MKNASDKRYREIQNTNFTFDNFFNRAVYDIMWNNLVQPERSQMAIWRMRITCLIAKATNTYSE